MIESRTAHRLLAAEAAVFGDSPDGEPSDLPRASSLALGRLVARLVERPERSLAWLLLTALAGAFPLADDVRAMQRAADLGTEQEATLALLDRGLRLAREHRTGHRPMRIVSGVVVDVDATARSDFHNGIQRVARETVRAWRKTHELTLVAWTDTAAITRDLSPREKIRAAYWGAGHEEVEPVFGSQVLDEDPDDTTLVVPWGATVVLAEVPLADRCPALAALAEMSGSTVVAIGYDAIPVVSADLRPPGEANAFTSYLSVIKHTSRVAGISTSASVEFEGFARALSSQGMSGPRVHEVQLPADVPPPPPEYRRAEPTTPQVLCVGRLEPHKNHAAILHAAERLWREGIVFDLTLVGADGWSVEVVQRQLEALRRAGRPIHRPGPVSDDAMWRIVRDASFSVFVSLHEGFGLPVAESLACGTPVITSSYGSQAEIAEAGGCLTVDPRDDDALLTAMRTLLTDPDTLLRLRKEALARPDRSWADYAGELWHTLVDDGTAR